MKVAVIGGGISGLSCAWLLSQAHEVHLFESENRLGGHANTVTVREGDSCVPIDTGFLVYNELTYPHLTSFFKALDVETTDSNMSLSVQVENSGLEWAGSNLSTIFAQRRNLLKIKFYLMLKEILRFGREAEENLSLARRHAWTLAELAHAKRYNREFLQHYLLPIGAAIWSMPESRMQGFPAATFLTFFINHKLLQVNNRPVWRTVKNGSIQYVQKAAKRIAKIRSGLPVLEVERSTNGVDVTTASGRLKFDKVVMATHAPITARLLKSRDTRERRVLSAFAFENNHTVLHTDAGLMPKRQRCWASWNVRGSDGASMGQKVSLTYYLNLLQPLKTLKNYFVTLNPDRELRGQLQEFNYSHPQFDQAAIRAQRELPDIQGQGGIYFAGAWTRYGFHEDGILSGVNVARLLGVGTPWRVG